MPTFVRGGTGVMLAWQQLLENCCAMLDAVARTSMMAEVSNSSAAAAAAISRRSCLAACFCCLSLACSADSCCGAQRACWPLWRSSCGEIWWRRPAGAPLPAPELPPHELSPCFRGRPRGRGVDSPRSSSASKSETCPSSSASDPAPASLKGEAGADIGRDSPQETDEVRTKLRLPP